MSRLFLSAPAAFRPVTAAVVLFMALLASLAAAHATVRTESGGSESLIGSSETYRLQVPVGRAAATTEVRLVVPAGLKVTRFLTTPGFVRTVKTDAAGLISEVTWTGSIAPMEFQRFLFTATNPAEAGMLVWKVYQRSADGKVVSWDGSSSATPASQTTVK